MCSEPQNASHRGRINANLFPPGGFVTAAMYLTVMSPAQWDSEFIADLATQRRGLRESQVMGIGRLTAADQTNLHGHRFNVLAIANAALRRQCKHCFIDHRSSSFSTVMPAMVSLLTFLRRRSARRLYSKHRQPRQERLLHQCSIRGD
jgi:hypothetical protein